MLNGQRGAQQLLRLAEIASRAQGLRDIEQAAALALAIADIAANGQRLVEKFQCGGVVLAKKGHRAQRRVGRRSAP